MLINCNACHRSFAEGKHQLVPELQKPWIDAEINRHAAVFNKYGLTWTLPVELKTKQYSDTESMPDEVVTAMITELRARHLEEDERRRSILLSTFRVSRPQVESRLNQLQQQKKDLTPIDYLLKLDEVSKDLWEIGSKRSAIMTLWISMCIMAIGKVPYGMAENFNR